MRNFGSKKLSWFFFYSQAKITWFIRDIAVPKHPTFLIQESSIVMVCSVYHSADFLSVFLKVLRMKEKAMGSKKLKEKVRIKKLKGERRWGDFSMKLGFQLVTLCHF